MKKRNLCMITTIYSLFEYLLYYSEKEIEDTFFVFEHWIPESITSQFEHKFILPRFVKPHMRDRRICWLWLRYIKWRYLPSFRKCNLIAHDHLYYSSVFIGHHKYIMLEDGPKMFSDLSVNKWIDGYKNSLTYKTYSWKWLRKLLFGPTTGAPLGANDQCTDLIVTSMDISPKLRGKNIHFFNMFQAWGQASDKKKKFIKKVFGTEKLTQQLAGRDLVYFSNAFCDDGVFTEDEYRDFYKKLLSRYDISKLVIKPHPRDYCKYYEIDLPGVMVLPSMVPSQLLDMLGVHFKKAISVASSSVLEMGYPIEVDWYSSKCHPNIIRRYADSGYIPKGVHYCKID